MSDENRAASVSSSPPRAVRLIFSFDDGKISLVSRQGVRVMTPPSESMERSLEGQSGFWVEVRNKAGQPLHRQIMHDPIRSDAEVFSDDPEQSIARIPVERPSGMFTILIPELAEADHIALMGTLPQERSAFGPAREIGHFSLADEPNTSGESQ